MKRMLQDCIQDYINAIQESWDVDAEYAELKFRDALDVVDVWEPIMKQVRDDIEWDRGEIERAKAIKEEIKLEAIEAAKEDAHYARLRGE